MPLCSVPFRFTLGGLLAYSAACGSTWKVMFTVTLPPLHVMMYVVVSVVPAVGETFSGWLPPYR